MLCLLALIKTTISDPFCQSGDALSLLYQWLLTPAVFGKHVQVKKTNRRKNKTHVFSASISTDGCLESPNGADLRWENSILFPPNFFFLPQIFTWCCERCPLTPSAGTRVCLSAWCLSCVRGDQGRPRLGCGLYSPCAPRPRELGGGIHLNVSPGQRRHEEANPPELASEEQTSQLLFSFRLPDDLASLRRNL